MMPDFSRGYLRIPHQVWRAVYCEGALTRRQLQLVSVVIRESWGWLQPSGVVHAWTRPLSTRQFAEATGLSIDHLRRDLDQLLNRGALRRKGDRYQLVADPELWTAGSPSSPLPRDITPEWFDPAAENALGDLAIKKEQRKQRNGRTHTERELSTGGEISPSSPSRFVPHGGARISATAAVRFADIIAAFVGSLSPEEADALRFWIFEDGIASVWSALEPAFRRGPIAGRRRLEQALEQRRDRG